MKPSPLRYCGLLLLLVLSSASAQPVPPKVAKIEIKHVGPAAASDDLIKANIRLKPGDLALRAAIDEDVRSLYATGLFYNIRVSEESTSNGVALTYIVQGKPKLMEINFRGNKRFSDAKLRKKITSKVGEPLDERKLFTDKQEIEKMYQKAGHQRTQVKTVSNVIEESGRATVTFEIIETPKVKIVEVQFVNAKAFSQRKLRKAIKTRKHWMFSGLPAAVTSRTNNSRMTRRSFASFIASMVTSNCSSLR